ncbi:MULTISPECIES: DUF397 domain-containing protein [Streptomyces]|uniref:DUF397 domain-containing protein n=1 Tax=Streptomyces fimbriatus TaxID=68197 RepID=A0ABW0D0J4_STRFI
MAIRDSERPTLGPLSFPAVAFNAFVEALTSDDPPVDR